MPPVSSLSRGAGDVLVARMAFFTKFTGAAAVHSDSQFAIAVAASTSRAQHMPAISELTAALASFIQQQQCTLCFNWVKAHAGHPWSEFADSLAGAVAGYIGWGGPHPPDNFGRGHLRVASPA